MRKFLIKISIYVLLLSVVVLGLDWWYITKNIDDIGAFENGVPDNIQICNFGSSHGRWSFDYEDIENDYVCFNFALGSQSLLYDFNILENYKDKIRKGAIVFLVVSYHSLFDKPETERSGFDTRNRRYYRFLPRNLIVSYDRETDLYVNYFPVLASSNIIEFIKNLSVPVEDVWQKVTNAEEIATQSLDENYVKFVSRKRNEKLWDSLHGMIKTLKELGATPILITTPYLHEYSDAIRAKDPKFFDDFYSAMKEISEKTGTKYYDYSRDERYMNDYSLFMDLHHLNKKGARIFTKIC